MEQDNKINNILLEILKDLNQLINYYKDNFSIKIVGNVINKINCFFNENKKNLQTQRNDMSSLFDKLNKSFDKLNKSFDKLEINNINKQELKCIDGKYIGQVVNGIREGKELGMVLMVIGMKVNGKMIKKKEKEYIIIIMVIDMKVIIEMVKKKEKEFIIIIGNLSKGMYMKVIGEMVKEKEKEFIIGMMVIEEWVIIIIINQ